MNSFWFITKSLVSGCLNKDELQFVLLQVYKKNKIPICHPVPKLRDVEGLKRIAWAFFVVRFPAAFPKLAKKSEVFPLHQG